LLPIDRQQFEWPALFPQIAEVFHVLANVSSIASLSNDDRSDLPICFLQHRLPVGPMSDG
jgi:hypothetical protein